MESAVDVIISGAGPVGLLAAIELTLGGARVLVLERLAAVNPAIKALSLGPLGAEALQRRGLRAAIDAAEAASFAALQAFTGQAGGAVRAKDSKFSGHFAGLPLIRKDAQKEPERRNRIISQQSVEAMLGERAQALGVEVRRTCELTGFTQQDDGVDVAWQSPTGPAQARCAYLIGCDGGRSLVRKLAGFDFPGTAPSVTMIQAVLEIDHPERLLPIGWQRTPRGVFSYGPFPGRLFMIDFSGPPPDRQAPVTRQEIETLLRHISGADVRVNALDVAHRWTDNTRLATSYRRGRVLLAGDAAHVHSPFGGQGLSLGLADAANLGWKLAAVVRGAVPENLLDSYTNERRPAAQAVLANTLAQLALLRPDPQSGALRDMMATLMACDGANRMIGEMTSGLGTRYDVGSHDDAVGRLIGDRQVRHGGQMVSLYDVMQDGRGVFIDSDGAGIAPEGVTVVSVDSGPSLLVRPDGCIAWAGASHGGLAAALERWF